MPGRTSSDRKRHAPAGISAADLLASLPGALFKLDAGWRLTYLNDRGEQLLERRAADLLGRNLWDEFPEAVGSSFQRHYVLAMNRRVPVTFTEYYPPLARWFSVHATPVDDGLLVHFHDVDALKEAEQRAAELARATDSLRRVASAVAAEAELEDLFRVVCAEVRRLLGGDGCCVLRFRGRDSRQVEVLGGGLQCSAKPGDMRDVEPGSPLAGARDGMAAVVPDPEHEDAACQAAFVPLHVGGRTWGALHVAWPRDQHDDEEAKRRLIELGGLVAVGIANAEARTAQVAAVARAEEQLTQQALLLDGLEAAVIATDLQGRVTYWNKSAERVAGWDTRTAHGRALPGAALRPQDAARAQEVLAIAREQGRWEGEFAATDRDGKRMLLYVRAVRSADPEGIVLFGIDISERRQRVAELDAAQELTLLSLTATIADGLLVVDPQGTIRYVNAAAAELLAAAEDDLIAERAARFLGEAAVRRQARCAPGEVCHADADVFTRADGRPLPVSWTSAPMPGQPEGSGRVIVFRDASERDEREQRLRREADATHWGRHVRDALAQDRVLLYAQPLIDVTTGAAFSHELLIRLRESDGTISGPGEFLAAAETHGLMADIDRWVVRQATELARAGRRVHVNVSAQSVGDRELVALLVDAAAQHGAEVAERITVELTETALADDPAGARAFAGRIRELGCRVALDDFGTGYNSFARIKELPLDELKIDRQFIGDLCSDLASEGVVRATISLAEALGVSTVAEGVEDVQTADRLRALGITRMQGFHFARPAPLVAA